MVSLSQKPLAVVTGASSGIGYELARQFLQHDYDVIVAAEDAEINTAAARLKEEAPGAEVEPVQVDLATARGVEKLYEVIKEDGRALDCIALNAGVGVHGDFARETSLEEELNLIALNVTSVVHLCKLALKDMVARDHGRVLITSSIAALQPGSFSAVYNASKAFLLLFAEAVREELKETGVTVTALMPGATETRFFERAGMEHTKIGQEKKDSAEDVARDGFEALMADKDKVISHSFKTKMDAFLSEILPHSASAAQHSKRHEPAEKTRH
jgi:short-subunit dehydrogenase